MLTIIAEKSILKGITAEGPNKLKHGAPAKRKRRVKSKKNKQKNNGISLTTRKYSSLRSQLSAIRQAVRPTVDYSTHDIITKTKASKSNENNKNNIIVTKRQDGRHSAGRHGVRKTSNHVLQQKLEWDKLKSKPASFKNLSKRSFLFSVEQIPRIDKITTYYIGLAGLSELCEIDSRFERFHDTLFESKRFVLYLCFIYVFFYQLSFDLFVFFFFGCMILFEFEFENENDS